MSMMDISPEYRTNLHKCYSPDCQNMATVIWCDKCLDELGEELEKHPRGHFVKINENIGMNHPPTTPNPFEVGKYSMSHHFDYLEKFVQRMKYKVAMRDDKYGHQPTNIKEIRKHLIDEIAELFDLSISESIDLRMLLRRSKIDKLELIDVANLCWILSYYMENENAKS